MSINYKWILLVFTVKVWEGGINMVLKTSQNWLKMSSAGCAAILAPMKLRQEGHENDAVLGYTSQKRREEEKQEMAFVSSHP